LGKLSRAQADKIIAMLPGLVTDVVNHAFNDIGAGFGPGSKLPMSLGSLGNLASLGNFAKLGSLAKHGDLADLGELQDLADMDDVPRLGDLSHMGDFSTFFRDMFGSFGSLGKISAGAGDKADAGTTVDLQT